MKYPLFIIIFFLVAFPAFSQKDSSIIRLSDPEGWMIHTHNSAYQILISKIHKVVPVFYGPREQSTYKENNSSWSDNIEEVPVRGGSAFKTPVLEVIYADHVRDADLRYVKAEVIEVENRPTLKIIQQDSVYPLQVISYIRVLAEYDILEKWIEVKNLGKKGNIKIDNLKSGSIVLPSDEYVLTQLSGKQLNEFQPYESHLSPGLKVIENKTFKSNFNAPWFQVRPQSSNNEEDYPVWFGSLHYSGNWQLIFDKSFNSTLQIIGGINFWDTEVDLKPGESMTTPKLSVGYSQKGADGAAQSLSGYVRNEILPVEHRHLMRPVLFNSWYTTTDKIREDQQLELARKAAQLGVELFVIDAGWYKSNNNSWTGMGTWEADKKKFPDGLQSFIKKINDLGLKFGIWVEPENVSESSDVYKAHPDWVLGYPTRFPTAWRRSLNLAKEEVYQHLLISLSKLLSENHIEFVKWDQNNYLSEPGWMDAPVAMQKEVRIKYIQNLYRLIDELRKRFPNVLFESCSSGGGRIDLGMMSRMDQAWVSDNTIADDRLFIQYGYLSAMPANTMVSWVIEKIANEVHQSTSLSFKFDVAMSGVLGIGYDIRKFSDEEILLAKKKIGIYKKIRPLVQQGVVYRLVSPFEHNRCALQYNSLDKDSSVIFCYNLAKYLPGSQLIDRGSKILKLKGLDPGKKYRLQNTWDEKDNGSVYPGDFLMKIGIGWPVNNAYESIILTLKEVL